MTNLISLRKGEKTAFFESERVEGLVKKGWKVVGGVDLAKPGSERTAQVTVTKYTSGELKSIKKDELVRLAKEKDLAVTSKMKKPEILEVFHANSVGDTWYRVDTNEEE